MATVVVKSTQFGTDVTRSAVAVASGNDTAIPGGYLFSTFVGGGAQKSTWFFVWFDETGKMRRIIANQAPVEYDPGSEEITFTNFNYNSDGTVIG